MLWLQFRNMNRSELVGETLRATLNVLSTVDPTWVAANVEVSWYLKYARRFESDRQTQTKDGIIATAEEVGRDGMALLERIWTEDAPPYLRSLPAVEQTSPNQSDLDLLSIRIR